MNEEEIAQLNKGYQGKKPKVMAKEVLSEEEIVEGAGEEDDEELSERSYDESDQEQD